MMGIVIGIDVGGSTTKIAGFRSRKEIISTMQVKATDPMTSVYGALGRFINVNGLQLGDVERIMLTGVGASVFSTDLYNIPTQKVDEFRAIGLGGLELSGKPEALVVSMGTGTAYVRASKDHIEHIGGSGVGGGTLVGLCSRLAGANHFEKMCIRDRNTTFEDQIELKKNDGTSEILDIHLALSPKMIKQYRDLQIRLTQLQKKAQENPSDMTMIAETGKAVVDIFSLLLGEENCKKVIAFYSDDFMQMMMDLFPYIQNEIVPKFQQLAKQRKQALKKKMWR